MINYDFTENNNVPRYNVYDKSVYFPFTDW